MVDRVRIEGNEARAAPASTIAGCLMAIHICAPRPRESRRWFAEFSIEKAARNLLLDRRILTQMPRLCLRTILFLFFLQSRANFQLFFQRRAHRRKYPPQIFTFSPGKFVGRRMTFDAAPRRAPTRKTEELPPAPSNDVGAERSILGAILLDNNAIDAAIERLKPEDFFHADHICILRQMMILRDAATPIDLVTLTDQLRRAGKLESVGGAAYVSQLMDGVPHITNVEHYARIVKEKSLLRAVVRATTLIQQQALEAEEGAAEIIQRATEALGVIQRDTRLGSLFHSHEEFEKAPPLRMAISQILQFDAATAVGALAGHGKTWVQLCIADALLRGPGTKLWGQFPVLETVPKILYLIPESSVGPFAHRLRTLKMLDFVKDGRLLVRTLSKGPKPSLSDPRLLNAARNSFVMLDTLVRFGDGASEDSAGEFQVLADAILALLGAGAEGVLAAHHSPKAFANASAITLEGVLRGTGDIGAVFASVFGIKQIDSEKNVLHVECCKSRDFEAPAPFQLIGRPYLDETGDFEMLKPPGVCGKLVEEQPPERDRGGAPAQVREAKLANKELVRQWLTADHSLSSNQLKAKLSEIGVTVDDSTVRRYRKELDL
jgi:hypothetical protein